MRNEVKLEGIVENCTAPTKFDSGKQLARMRVKNVRQPGGTTWLTVIGWDGMAEVLSSFEEGQGVRIEGTIRTRKYVDKTGENRYVTEIIADKATKANLKDIPRQSNDNADIPY